MLKAIPIAVLVALMLMVSGATSQTPSSVIHGCVETQGGRLTLHDIKLRQGEVCQEGTRPLNWNRRGPIGPQGEQGIQGEQGEQGPPGTSGITDTFRVAGNLITITVPPNVEAGTSGAICPSTSFLISGGIQSDGRVQIHDMVPDLTANVFAVNGARTNGEPASYRAFAICAESE